MSESGIMPQEVVAPPGTKRLKYLSARPLGVPLDYSIQAFERSIARCGVKALNNDGSFMNFTGRALKKLGMIRRLADMSHTAYIAPVMQIAEDRIFPVCYVAETMVYAFDCWAPAHDRWEAFFRRHKMRIAFISARISAERMAKRVPGLETIWMPEAIDPAPYSAEKPVKKRSIDVLELGRRYDIYHDRIREHCVSKGYQHRYELRNGQLVFSSAEDFYRGLADTKISICFPSSITHPARSGDVETLTVRYLESIACKNIIVGRCPQELKDLFGFNPVVEADMGDAAGQIDDILANVDAYGERLDRNLQRLREVGTWDTRVETILSVLRQRGFTW